MARSHLQRAPDHGRVVSQTREALAHNVREPGACRERMRLRHQLAAQALQPRKTMGGHVLLHGGAAVSVLTRALVYEHQLHHVALRIFRWRFKVHPCNFVAAKSSTHCVRKTYIVLQRFFACGTHCISVRFVMIELLFI